MRSNPAKDSTSDRVRITMIAPSTPPIIIVDVLDIVASDIAGALDLCHFCTCNIWFLTYCTLDILGSLTFGLLHS